MIFFIWLVCFAVSTLSSCEGERRALLAFHRRSANATLADDDCVAVDDPRTCEALDPLGGCCVVGAAAETELPSWPPGVAKRPLVSVASGDNFSHILALVASAANATRGIVVAHVDCGARWATTYDVSALSKELA